MSSEQIMNKEESSRNNKRKRGVSNKQTKEEKSQQIKFPQPIIYEPSENNFNQQNNLSLTTSNDNNQDQRGQNIITNTDAKEITDYYFTFHKNMLIIYNSLYSQMLQDISNSYNNGLLTFNERIIDYSTQIENMFNGLTSKRDKSLKLVDNIITENLDTYIKSIKQAQKFYKDVTKSYFNCIREKNSR